MTKQVKVLIVILIVAALCVAGFVVYRKNYTLENMVGGDKDEHGCIGSAGYSWCEVKNKCLRIWEEPCYVSVEDEIQHILAEKYDKSVDDVKIVITKQDGNYAAGSVVFGQGGLGEGGMFLAVKESNAWQVVFDGNGSVDCENLRQEYGFTNEVLSPEFCD